MSPACAVHPGVGEGRERVRGDGPLPPRFIEAARARERERRENELKHQNELTAQKRPSTIPPISQYPWRAYSRTASAAPLGGNLLRHRRSPPAAAASSD